MVEQERAEKYRHHLHSPRRE